MHGNGKCLLHTEAERQRPVAGGLCEGVSKTMCHHCAELAGVRRGSDGTAVMGRLVPPSLLALNVLRQLQDSPHCTHCTLVTQMSPHRPHQGTSGGDEEVFRREITQSAH